MADWRRANMLLVSVAISIALGFAARLPSADLLPSMSKPRAVSQTVPASQDRPKPAEMVLPVARRLSRRD